MLERRREPRLSWNCTAPPSETIQRPPGSVLRPCRKSTGESGGIQAPGACGPGLQGAWGPGCQGLGPGPSGVWGLFPFRKPPGGSLAKAWVSAETAASEVGTWREAGIPPLPPPPPPYPPPAFWGCKGERKRVFTLSAFGNHPTRPPRSADIIIKSEALMHGPKYFE